MVYQYHDIIGHNYILILFTESDGQTPKIFKRENEAADLKGGKQNFQYLSDVVNILVSVTGTCKMLCLYCFILHHTNHMIISKSLSFKINSIKFLLLNFIVFQIKKFLQQCKGILPLYRNYLY